MSRLAGNLQKLRLTVSILPYTCLIGKPNMGAYSGREMYCHSVITVKTEYSIRKFVSANKTGCTIGVYFGPSTRVLGDKSIVLDFKMKSLISQ